jgi:signal transduction histidine kinase
MKGFLDTLIGSRSVFSIQHRIFNTTLLAGAAITAISGLMNLIIGLNPITYLVSLLTFVVLAVCLWFSHNTKNLYLISRLSFSYLLFFFFPLSWFINSGSHGSFTIFSIMFLVAMLTTMPGRRTIYLFLYYLTILGCLYVEYFYPQLIIEYPGRTDRFIDFTIAFSILYPGIYGIVNIFVKMYEKNNRLLKGQKEELELTSRMLKESNHTKDKFFSIIAHDLRSPFNSIMGFSDLLNEEYDSMTPDEQKKCIHVMNDSIHNTFKLLENLLIWSRSQQGTIEYNPHEESLIDLYTEVENLVSFSADDKRISLINNIPDDLLVFCDKYMVLTVLRNLLSNAIKFTCGDKDIHTKAWVDKNKVFVSVKDQGIGMSQDQQSKLFDPGTHVSTKGTANESGSGLGLILCKELVERHGGEVFLESEEGKGSMFTFTIPIPNS